MHSDGIMKPNGLLGFWTCMVSVEHFLQGSFNVSCCLSCLLLPNACNILAHQYVSPIHHHFYIIVISISPWGWLDGKSIVIKAVPEVDSIEELVHWFISSTSGSLVKL